LIDKYGADALRMSLLYGTPAGSKVILSDDKVRSMRNFTNKIWNLGRYVQFSFEGLSETSINRPDKLNGANEKLLLELSNLIKKVDTSFDKYNLNTALEAVYEFSWHVFADVYIEKTKEQIKSKDLSTLWTLRYTYLTILKLLHPFAPFITEAVWEQLNNLRDHKNINLITSSWPK